MRSLLISAARQTLPPICIVLKHTRSYRRRALALLALVMCASTFTFPQTAVLTFHNDTQRTGQNLSETVLTPSNVASATFGKLWTYPTVGNIYAQPLYLPALMIPGNGTFNVIFVATENDSVYAFNADSQSPSPLWKRSFLNSALGVTPVPQADVGGPITPEYGITGTPVIDPSTQTMYLVAFTKENGNYVQRLHALDVTTGNDRAGSPVVISATVSGTGVGNDGAGNIAFQPKIQLQRPALLLAGGVVYIAWGSFDDQGPYHGWVMGYSTSTLQQVAVWNSTPNGSGGSVWQAGGGLAKDPAGNIWLMTGNGTFDANTGGRDYGDSIIKLSPSSGLSAINYFTPYNQQKLNTSDQDLGSGGIMLLPPQSALIPNLAIGAGKGGTIYLVNRSSPGHFNSSSDSQIVQSIPNAIGVGAKNSNYSTPSYWNGNVYFLGNNDVLKQFVMSAGMLQTPPITGTHVYGFPGATTSISANGNSNGIVWVLERIPLANALLHAYDAANVAHELYNSNQAGTRDQFGAVVKFSVPTVVNGRVYVGAKGHLVVFGLLP